MVVQKYKDMLQGKSVIRQLSEFATARGAEIGYELTNSSTSSSSMVKTACLSSDAATHGRGETISRLPRTGTRVSYPALGVSSQLSILSSFLHP